MIEFLNDIAVFSVSWSPLLPTGLLFAVSAGVVFLALFSLVKQKKASFLRFAAALCLLVVLFNPTLVKEKREPTKDTAILVVDKSPSQEFGDRAGRSNKAARLIASEIRGIENVDLRVIEVDGSGDGLVTQTRLFDEIRKTLADIPVSQRAGVVIISDGQIHDVPALTDSTNNIEQDLYGPVHVLLSGSKDDKDRHLIVEEAPAYGIVGQDVSVRFRIADTPNIRSDGTARITVRESDGRTFTAMQPVDESIELNLPVRHAGQNVYEIQAETVDGELTHINNKTAILVNGVRDRLKVLLISGKPHPGERTWRNILTSDPAVDLVHFTILREPHKLNNVPQDELSLIPFPFRELFEVKLYDFDLIIFDRYRANRIMPKYYFGNIAKYVRQGGALLEASGPAFASGQSIYDTALGDILPSIPTGEVLEKPFTPVLTDLGQRHPVTRDLNWDQNKKWGSWLRQVDVTTGGGDVVMSGVNDRALLVLDRIEDGRVAHLTSDLIWLWSRGYEGGGPQADLLRRLAHWLMKEPELEENALDITVSGQTLTIRRRSLTESASSVEMTRPDDTTRKIELTQKNNGWSVGYVNAKQLGIYKFRDGDLRRVALVGAYNPPELQGVITTGEKVNDIVEQTDGAIVWLAEQGEPNVRYMPANSVFSGYGWIGLRKNGDYTVTGVTSKSLLPDFLTLLFLAGIFVFTWWREGRAE